MDHRPLGRTGVSVSHLRLGAMMFGVFGNPDHDDAVRIVGKALAGGRRDHVVLATKEISGPGSVARRQRFGAHLDANSPANAAKLDAADALGALADEAGLTLIQMAIAFVTRHPAVTSAIVAPGHTVTINDNMWSTSTAALETAARRR